MLDIRLNTKRSLLQETFASTTTTDAQLSSEFSNFEPPRATCGQLLSMDRNVSIFQSFLEDMLIKYKINFVRYSRIDNIDQFSVAFDCRDLPACLDYEHSRSHGNYSKLWKRFKNWNVYSFLLVFIVNQSCFSQTAAVSSDLCSSIKYRVISHQEIQMIEPVNAVNWSHDGKYIITSSSEGNIATIWTREGVKLNEINQIRKGMFPVDSIEMLNNSIRVLIPAIQSTSSAYSLTLWDVGNGGQIQNVIGPQPDMNSSYNLAWHYTLSPDSRYVIVAPLRGNHVILYETNKWETKWNITLDHSAASSLAFSSNSDTVGIGTVDGYVLLLGTENAKTIARYTVYHDISGASVDSLKFSPNGQTFAAGAGLSVNGHSEPTTVKILNVKDGVEYRSYTEESQPIRGLSWIMGGCAIAIADSNSVIIHEVDDLNAPSLKLYAMPNISGIAALSSTGVLAVATGNHVEIFSLE